MDLQVPTSLWSWFGSATWLNRYLIVMFAIFIPSLISSIISGTFFKSEKCDIPFNRDLTFLIMWLVSIPLFISLLPWYYSKVGESLQTLSSADSSILLLKLTGKSGLFDQNIDWLGIPLGVTIVIIVCILNFRALKDVIRNGATKWSWWFPSGKICLATWIFFIFSVIFGIIGSIALVRYVSTVITLRIVINNIDNVPTWYAAPAGPIWIFFNSSFLLTLPLSLIPISVWFARTFRGKISLADPITIITMTVIPVSAIVLIFLPIVSTGLPFRLQSQLDVFLIENAKETSLIHNELSTVTSAQERKLLVTRLKDLSEEKKVLKDNYPIWPFSTSILSRFTLIFIPAIFPIIHALTNLLKRIYTSLPRNE